MTNTKRTLSAKQLAVLAAGRAKAKANRDKVEATLSYVQTPVLNIQPETAKPAGLSHDAARAKLKELGLAGQRLPGRQQTLVAGGVSITNVKGTFHFSAAPEKPEAKPVPELPPQARSLTVEEIIAALQFMTRHDLKI